MVDTHEHMPKQITSADIGYALKSAREELGISLVEISDKTRIAASYLEHIEAGRFDLLPSAAYVKGFLRNYCQIVHVDPAPLIEALSQADSSVSQKPEYRFPVQALVPKMASSMIALIIVCFALGGYVFWVTAINDELEPGSARQIAALPEASLSENQFDDIPVLLEPEATAPREEVAVQEENADITAPDITTGIAVTENQAETSSIENPVISDDINPVATLETTLSEAPVEPKADQQLDAAALQTADAEQSENPPVQAPEKRTGEAAIETASLVSEQDNRAPIEEPEALVPTNSVGALATPRAPAREIVITATSASWIEIARRDGEVLVSKLLRKGEKLVSAMDEELLLSTGNAGGLTVRTNEIEDFDLGKVGEILRDLPLSRDGMRARHNLISF